MRFFVLIASVLIVVVAALPAIAQLDSLVIAPEDSLKVAQANAVLATLESLPVGLSVVHTPNPATAVEDSTAYYRFTWNYSTSVQSTSGEVTIVDFGTLSRVGDQWIFANYNGKPFGSTEFAKWYGCESAVVREGVPCTDPSNWTGSGCLGNLNSLWYFIGEDQAGRRVQGSAEISMLPVVVPASR